MRISRALLSPFNLTFHMTTSANECLDRLKRNLSDTSSVFVPIETMSTGYYAPLPLFTGKIQYIAGYNVTDAKRETVDTATVFTNADLLKPSVYLWASILLMMLMTFIAVKVALFYRPIGRFARLSRVHFLKRQLSRVFYYNSERFRWITLLYSLLCFIMITSFLCLYKTSHIIMEKPFYPKDYQESLDYPPSLAFCYDQFSIVSTAFKDASPDSIRGKLWAKLTATGRQDEYKGAAIDASSLYTVVHSATKEMKAHRSILIISPMFITLFRSGLCGLSPEGELWIVKVGIDPIEKEVIYGYAQSNNFHVTWFSSRMKALFETDFLAHTYEKQFDLREFAAKCSGTSKSHQWRQKAVCDDENAFSPGPVVKAISLSYFAPMFKSILIVWLSALILHVFRILHAEK